MEGRSSDASYATAYDPATDLRLVRISGRFDAPGLMALVPYDPTLEHLPQCRTLVDVRGHRFDGAPSELAELADLMRRLVNPEFGERYVWLVDRPDTLGVASLYRREMGSEGQFRWFTNLEGALEHLDITAGDFDRLVAMLVPVTSDG